MKIQALTPAIGATVSNIDIGSVGAGVIGDLRDALLVHKVLFFRDQKITIEEHIAFARQFGELEIHPATPKDQPHREVFHIAHGPKSRGAENFWHSDVTWREQPSLGSILRARRVPPVGGDTLFANMSLAYERLSESTRERIQDLVAVHDIARVFAKRLGKKPEELHELYPPVEHPVIRTHPETGDRVVYVNGAFTSHIKDMDIAQSNALLDELYKSAWNPEVQCRFRWETDSIAFWDSRACQHFAVSDYFPERRDMERVTIAGDKPYFDRSA